LQNGHLVDGSAQNLAAGRADGKVVVSTREGRVIVLDLKTGTITAEFKGPPGTKRPLLTFAEGQKRHFNDNLPITAVAVQLKGSLAASSWEDGTVDIWQVEDGRWIRTLVGNKGRVRALAMRPNGRQLAVANNEGSVTLWDVESGRPERTLQGPNHPKGLCYSPDGRHLVQAGMSHRILIWDPDAGEILRTRKGHEEHSLPHLGHGVNQVSILCAAYSPDGHWLATGGFEGRISLWDAKNDYALKSILSTESIRSSDSFFSLRSNRSAANTPESSLYDPQRGGDVAVQHITFSANSQELVAGLLGAGIRLYDLKPILELSEKPSDQLLAYTERRMGLRLENDQLVPAERNVVVREGATLRENFEQDQSYVLSRISAALANARVGQHGKACEQLQSLLSEPGVPEHQTERARTNLALSYRALGKLDKAETELGKILARNPYNLEARHGLADCYLQQSNFPKAFEIHNKILAEPGLTSRAETDTRTRLALLYEAMGEAAKAEEEIRKALAGDPDSPSIHGILGNILVKHRKYREAKDIFEKIISHPGLPDKDKWQVQGLRATQQTKETAARTMLQAQNLARASLSRLASVLAEQVQDPESLKILESLRDDGVIKDDPVLWDSLGDFYSHCNKLKDAHDSWEKALKLFPATTAPADVRKRKIEEKKRDVEKKMQDAK
jgi:Tfp pilus assembly protein PilF